MCFKIHNCIYILTALKLTYAINSVTPHMKILKYICHCPEHKPFLLKDHEFWVLFLISKNSTVSPSESSLILSVSNYTLYFYWKIASTEHYSCTPKNSEYSNIKLTNNQKTIWINFLKYFLIFKSSAKSTSCILILPASAKSQKGTPGLSVSESLARISAIDINNFWRSSKCSHPVLALWYKAPSLVQFLFSLQCCKEGKG